MNQPLRLVRGEMLYSQVRHIYGPLSPYINATLYRLFGPSLGVLYGDGIVTAIMILALVYWLSRKVERDVQRRLPKMRDRLEIRRRSQRLSKPGPDAGPRTHSTAPRELALQQLEALIGLEVRRLRKSRDLTVAQLGAAAGISTGMLSKVENGATSPSLATLHALATALSVPITQLFARTDDYRYCSVDGETREHTARS